MERNEILREVRRASNKNGAAMLLYTLIVYGANIAAAVLSAIVYPEGTGPLDEFLMTVLNLVNIAALTFGAYYIKATSKKAANVTFGFCRPALSAADVIKLSIIVLGISYFFGYVSDYIISAIESTGVQMSDIETDTSTPVLYILNLVGMAIFAPLFEELLFRGGLTGNVRRFGGFSMALAVGFMFGIWHENIYQFFYVTAMGTALCMLTMKTKSIFPALIIHFIFNADAVPIMLLELIDTDLADVGYAMFLIFELVLIVAAVILLISTLILDKSQLSLKNPTGSDYSEAGEFEKFIAYFTAPCTIICVIFSVFMTVINATL
jgi:membrane protease YdiL (CAAX protease family)